MCDLIFETEIFLPATGVLLPPSNWFKPEINKIRQLFEFFFRLSLPGLLGSDNYA